MDTTWQNQSLKSFPPYSGKKQSDVVIVGGGITGISTAYLLARKGKKVIVLEKEELTQTNTAYTTAFLTSSIDTNLSDIKKVYGLKMVRKMIDSHEEAISTIEKIIKDEKIECQFERVPYYTVAFKKQTLKSLKETKYLLDEALHASSIISAKTFPFKNFGALKLTNQAKFHPLMYLKELRERAKKLGVQFYEHSEVLSIEGEEDILVKLAKRHASVKTKNVVIATYQPFKEPKGFIWKKGMYTSYVMELEVPKGTLPPMLMEDDSNPYHYVRVDAFPKHDRIIIGGQDHRKEIPLDPNRGYNALKDFIENRLEIRTYKIVKKWTGAILESSDGLALIGLQSKKFNNRYVATAFSGNGMTYGTISAMLISDLISGDKNRWQKIYDPRRKFSLRGVMLKAKDYTEEFIHGVGDNLSHSNAKI